ncbi:hypothetical protein [Marinomonas balearica]|uniref:hypothetical protein n=1 Tax=Marinomonas balearica TaxID=491947 RepID=UPI0014150574|nr:hypothetical protein [Marinomonas balearica]
MLHSSCYVAQYSHSFDWGGAPYSRSASGFEVVHTPVYWNSPAPEKVHTVKAMI